MQPSTFEKPIETDEEAFEDIGLNDDPVKPKKKGFLSRFSDSANDGMKAETSHHFHLPGRKRGQSGTGNELGSIEQQAPRGKSDGVIR